MWPNSLRQLPPEKNYPNETIYVYEWIMNKQSLRTTNTRSLEDIICKDNCIIDENLCPRILLGKENM